MTSEDAVFLGALALFGLVVVSVMVAVVLYVTRRDARATSRRVLRERDQLAALLNDAEARNQLLLTRDNTMGWWEYDTATGDVIGARQAWLRLGGSKDAVPVDLASGLAIIHPDDHGEVWKVLDARDDGLRRAIVRVVRPELPLLWIEIAAMPMADQPHRLLGVTIDVTARSDAEADLVFRIEHDELTGCANRTGLTRVVREALDTGTPFSLLVVDLDHFTDINVTLGHPVGDHVLAAVARRFAWTLRRHDLLARIGADEFAVVVRTSANDGGADASTVAAELVEVLDIPVEVDGVAITARASVGVVAVPEDGRDVDTLFRRAELALQRAKVRGGTWARFDPLDEAAAARRLELSESLPAALAQPDDPSSGLDVHFQPIIELATARVGSAEALVRWRHARLGTVPPMEVVALAGRYGMGVELFRFVLGRSLAQLSVWRAAGVLDSIAVNVSPFQLVDPQLFGIVADALIASDLPPSALTLEITEEALIDQAGDAIATLRRLHELGVRLAIDDFGTGYSSLTHLRLLHIDILKLDSSFVLGLGAESRQDALVSLAVGTAHQLGLKVVAEGVEDADTLAMLGQHGCDAAQGFHMCRPAPADVITTWLSGRPRSTTHGHSGRDSGRDDSGPIGRADLGPTRGIR